MSHENASTLDPDPEVAPTQSTEDPFDRPIGTPSPLLFPVPPLPPVPSPEIPPIASSCKAQSSPHSRNEALQEFTDLQPTLMIP
ncbi:hypothetical protein O181_005748 [Austropuccinia psidii MF-1]|uniref:Uncharacterized protein n=1 Tax=Austropuccinia psidii MF-1 TaxID=1389203 RepID=A0A9Q3BJ41_9BASI|nr:hypothetical protein [Austropuccinia psidii MF-1]